jgi:hypothetical protein
VREIVKGCSLEGGVRANSPAWRHGRKWDRRRDSSSASARYRTVRRQCRRGSCVRQVAVPAETTLLARVCAANALTPARHFQCAERGRGLNGGQTVSEDLLTCSTGVDVGGIEKIGPQIKCFLDDRLAAFVVKHPLVNPPFCVTESMHPRHIQDTSIPLFPSLVLAGLDSYTLFADLQSLSLLATPGGDALEARRKRDRLIASPSTFL